MILTFTALSNEAVALNGKLVYGTDFYKVKINHSEVETADGELVVHSAGVFVVYTKIIMKGVEKTQFMTFLDWLEDIVCLSTYKFNITNPSSSVNLGTGFGQSISSAKYAGGNSTKDIYTFVAPGMYDINLPIRFLN